MRFRVSAEVRNLPADIKEKEVGRAWNLWAQIGRPCFEKIYTILGVHSANIEWASEVVFYLCISRPTASVVPVRLELLYWLMLLKSWSVPEAGKGQPKLIVRLAR